MAQLELDITATLRDFVLGVELSAGAETVALVGPSGAGKSTVLRALAGLHRPDAGRIAVDGTAWFDGGRKVDLPPERRRVGLVFQDHALFPHLTVRANVAYGGADRADELLERMRISHLAGEKPRHLSGGERQRVALARALARDPGVLALDEPLSALDAATRGVVRAELQDVLAELRLPALLVTHDFGDAVVLADRVGVIVDGRLRQLGPPVELVEAPADAFVAQFTGANVLWGEAADGAVALEGGGRVPVAAPARGRVALAVQPWHVSLAREPVDGASAVRVAAVTAEHGRVRVRTDRLTADVDDALGLARGDVAWAVVDPGHARIVGS